MSKEKQKCAKIGTYSIAPLKNGSVVYKKQLKLGTDRLTGKQAVTTVTANSLKSLQIEVARKKREFQENGSSLAKRRVVGNFKELADFWMESFELGVKTSTVRCAKGCLSRYLEPELGRLRLDEIDTPLLQGLVQKWQEAAEQPFEGRIRKPGHSKDLSGRFFCLKRIFDFGMAMGYLTLNPIDKLIKPRMARQAKEAPFFDREQAVFLLEGLAGHKPPMPNHPPSVYRAELVKVYIYFMIYTGLRPSEALALKWSDLDFGEGGVSITKTVEVDRNISDTPKSLRSCRQVLLDEATVKVTRRWGLYQAEAFLALGMPKPVHLFPPLGKSRPMGIGDVTMDAKKIYGRLGLPVEALHILRHTHASLMVNGGIGLKEIQERLGHDNLATTMNCYGHLFKETEEKLVQTLEDYLSP